MWRDNPTNTIRFSLCPNLCYVTKRICELLNKSIKSNLISALYNNFISKAMMLTEIEIGWIPLQLDKIQVHHQ